MLQARSQRETDSYKDILERGVKILIYKSIYQ